LALLNIGTKKLRQNLTGKGRFMNYDLRMTIYARPEAAEGNDDL
jgi:hypothetical protein